MRSDAAELRELNKHPSTALTDQPDTERRSTFSAGKLLSKTVDCLFLCTRKPRIVLQDSFLGAILVRRKKLGKSFLKVAFFSYQICSSASGISAAVSFTKDETKNLYLRGISKFEGVLAAGFRRLIDCAARRPLTPS
jgi:hypothetical protein